MYFIKVLTKLRPVLFGVFQVWFCELIIRSQAIWIKVYLALFHKHKRSAFIFLPYFFFHLFFLFFLLHLMLKLLFNVKGSIPSLIKLLGGKLLQIQLVLVDLLERQVRVRIIDVTITLISFTGTTVVVVRGSLLTSTPFLRLLLNCILGIPVPILRQVFSLRWLKVGHSPIPIFPGVALFRDFWWDIAIAVDLLVLARLVLHNLRFRDTFQSLLSLLLGFPVVVFVTGVHDVLLQHLPDILRLYVDSIAALQIVRVIPIVVIIGHRLYVPAASTFLSTYRIYLRELGLIGSLFLLLSFQGSLIKHFWGCFRTLNLGGKVAWFTLSTLKSLNFLHTSILLGLATMLFTLAGLFLCLCSLLFARLIRLVRLVTTLATPSQGVKLDALLLGFGVGVAVVMKWRVASGFRVPILLGWICIGIVPYLALILQITGKGLGATLGWAGSGGGLRLGTEVDLVNVDFLVNVVEALIFSWT